jgi:hypothetical protein
MTNTTESPSDRDLADSEAHARFRERRLRMIELYFCLVVAVLIAGRVIFELSAFPSEAEEIFRVRYVEIVLAALAFIFPVVYRLIFNALPFESIRLRRSALPVLSYATYPFSSPTIYTQPAGISTSNVLTAPEEKEAQTNSSTMVSQYSVSSRQLARGIYSRAGVYLLIGVLIAFSGLVFFYAQTASQPQPTAVNDLLLNLAPKFGILFFIEFVALFFLRQYRSAMDEFRYYEAIARVREEVRVLLQLAADMGTKLDPLELIKSGSFFSKSGTLAKGDTTEIIESRKLEKNELDLLEKMVEVLSRSKK